jgi:hypothetical protein
MAEDYQSVSELVASLGGVRRLAQRLRVAEVTLADWIRGDRIPAQHHARLLAVCALQGVDWRPPGWPERVRLHVVPKPENGAPTP